MPTLTMFYVPCPSRESAEKLASALLDDRLVACANISAPVTSMYWWEERLETEEEVVLVMKTTAMRMDEAAAAIERLHPYEVPCVARTEIAVNAAYAEWAAKAVM